MTSGAQADVVIVGGGLLGLATARALRDRREVLVLEQDAVGHARGGSPGRTRIFRLGYADPGYVSMAQEASEHWRALEAEAATRLLHPTPQLTFGPGADAVFAALTAAGAPAPRRSADRSRPRVRGRPRRGRGRVTRSSSARCSARSSRSSCSRATEECALAGSDDLARVAIG